MHGYIDSFPVPLRAASITNGPTASSSKSQKAKGKERDIHGQTQAQSSAAAYDVVANWSDQEKREVERKVLMAARLGYSTIVLTLPILPTTNPSNLIFPTPLFPEMDPRTAKAESSSGPLILQLWKIHVTDYGDEAVKNASQKGFYGFSNSTASLFPASVSIISVTPTTLTTFSHVALSLSPPSLFSPTLITLDPSLSPRLPFPLKRGLAHTLQRAGVVFEIVYRGITKQDEPGTSSNASQRRRNWIAGAREIVRATGGKGVVLSSGAGLDGEMRAPEDLINLCSLIGLTPAQAKDALTINPQRAIARGMALRQTYRGVMTNPSVVTNILKAASENDSAHDVATVAGEKRPIEAALEEGTSGRDQTDEVLQSGKAASKKRKKGPA